MSAAFTPGPWTVVGWDDGESLRVMGTTPTGMEGCYSVADVINGNGSPQNAANARLIATAPEMYAELLDILRSIKGGGDVVTFGAADIARYEALLDRATGTAS